MRISVVRVLRLPAFAFDAEELIDRGASTPTLKPRLLNATPAGPLKFVSGTLGTSGQRRR